MVAQQAESEPSPLARGMASAFRSWIWPRISRLFRGVFRRRWPRGDTARAKAEGLLSAGDRWRYLLRKQRLLATVPSKLSLTLALLTVPALRLLGASLPRCRVWR